MTISLYHFTPRVSELQSNSGMIPLPGCGVAGLQINGQNVEYVIDYYFHLLPELLNVLQEIYKQNYCNLFHITTQQTVNQSSLP
jgi:hypothetical protein